MKTITQLFISVCASLLLPIILNAGDRDVGAFKVAADGFVSDYSEIQKQLRAAIWKCASAEELKKLLDAGAVIAPSIEKTILLAPLHYGEHACMVHRLVDLKADVNARNRFSETPLLTARNTQVMDALIAHGAKVRRQNNWSQFPLFHYIYLMEDSTDAVKNLENMLKTTQACQDVNRKTLTAWEHTTPFEEAVRRNLPNAALCLMRYGARPEYNPRLLTPAREAFIAEVVKKHNAVRN